MAKKIKVKIDRTWDQAAKAEAAKVNEDISEILTALIRAKASGRMAYRGGGQPLVEAAQRGLDALARLKPILAVGVVEKTRQNCVETVAAYLPGLEQGG